MLAAAEIFGIPVFLIVLVIYFLAKAAENQGKNLKEPTSRVDSSSDMLEDEFEDEEEEFCVGVGLTGIAIHVPAAAGPCAGLIRELLVHGKGFRVEQNQFPKQLFRRGDFSVARVLARHQLSWKEHPILLSVQYRPAGSSTVVKLAWNASPDTKFDRQSKENFYVAARQDSLELEKSILSMLEANGAQARSRQTEYYCSDWAYEARENDEEDQAEESGEDECDAEGDTDETHDEDFDELGLTPAAQWGEVQAAYRQICHKYHPDRLAHLNLPPHLIELASTRFKRATQAYHSLRHGRFGHS